jgi:hypothetical protein
MSLLRFHDLDHGFYMPFFNISFLRIVLFVLDFLRYYFNSSIFFSFIQTNFISQNKKNSFLNNIVDVLDLA